MNPKQWHTVLFSDEADSTHSVVSVEQKNEQFGGGRVHVWSSISFHHRTLLHGFQGPVNAKLYINNALQPFSSRAETSSSSSVLE
ncbi:hypothetical protein RRG08_059757 [Elysia crispata]|uniref:Uncharacterized protein n=1 Tax=Elysia crispata TaxID=231223 RepID=A0AAE1BE83_9GAST|nr:hypothetical protein RRG08_059757 [Elysia crispata]